MIAKRIFAMGAVLGALLGTSPATAQRDAPFYADGLYGWYEAGPAYAPRARLRDFFGVPVGGAQLKFDPGFHFGIGIGREITPVFKVEVESGYNYNGLDRINGATASSANFHRVPVLANLVLQYPTPAGIVPMIGAGVGGQWLHLDAQNIVLAGTTLNDSSDTWVFTYQGFAGVSYQFWERFGLGLFYRFNVADSPSWEFRNVPGNFKLNQLRTHSVSLTFSWVF
ncbi:MAG TPA: outer membrane beta-barrel protein [Verrucomicrobiota bacterium]|nr:outer membrane beta-barrel protein [Verrucomicrobiota bacterium]HNT13701.1 outer membrane beta-barrel protein [Verrucomicrobiota bacterium]